MLERHKIATSQENDSDQNSPNHSKVQHVRFDLVEEGMDLSQSQIKRLIDLRQEVIDREKKIIEAEKKRGIYRPKIKL